jgi:hypothetical protein
MQIWESYPGTVSMSLRLATCGTNPKLHCVLLSQMTAFPPLYL